MRIIGGFLRCTVHIIQAAFLLTANRVTCSNHDEFRDPQEARIAHNLSFTVIFVVKYSLSSFHPCSKAFTFGGTAEYSILSITLIRHLSDPPQVYINPQVAPFLFTIPHLFMETGFAAVSLQKCYNSRAIVDVLRLGITSHLTVFSSLIVLYPSHTRLWEAHLVPLIRPTDSSMDTPSRLLTTRPHRLKTCQGPRGFETS